MTEARRAPKASKPAGIVLPQLTANEIPAPLQPLAPRYRRAAQLVGEDLQTDEQIAFECGIARSTLHIWRQRDDFRAAVAQIRTVFDQQIMNDGLARRTVRLREKIRRHRAIMQEVEIRGKEFKVAARKATEDGDQATNKKEVGLGFAGAAGVVSQRKTEAKIVSKKAEPKGNIEAGFDVLSPVKGEGGLLTRTVKMIGSGPFSREVEEFVIDAATSRELSRLEDEISIETGQRIEKHSHEVKGVVFVATRAIGSDAEMTAAAGRQRARQLREAQRNVQATTRED